MRDGVGNAAAPGRRRFRPSVVLRPIARAVAVLAVLLGACVAARAATGEASVAEIDVRGTRLTVYMYRPACENPALLVVMHGKNRSADRYMRHARALADSRCLLVAAPEFDKERFPAWSYQHGGIEHKGRLLSRRHWTVRLIPDLVAKLRAMEGRPMPYSLIGHSGGGQILSRLAAFIGSDAQRIVIANPSSHVWPDFRPAPYGLGGVFDARSRELALRTYLALPVTIYVGTADTGAKDLDQRPEAMRQGATRYERGRRVFEAAQEAARRHGWACNWRLVLAPGVAHSAKEMLAPRAWEALQPE